MMRKTALSFSFSVLVTSMAIGLFAHAGAAQKPKDVRRSAQLAEQGDRSLGQRNYRDAVVKYAEAIAFNPKNAAARFAKGKAHSNLNEPEMALMELNAAMEQGYQKPIDVYLIRYKIYYDAKDFAQAQKDVDAALLLEPDNPELLLAQGEMSFANKRYPQALDAFQRVLQRQPNNAEVYLNIAKLHYMTNNVQSQGEAAQEALNKQTRFPGEANLLLGDSMRKQRRYAEATTALTNALASDPRNLEIYQSLGELYRAQNKYEDAIAIYRRALTVFGTDGRIYTGLSWYYSLANRHEDAAEAAKAGIRLLPNEYLAYTNLCRAYNDLKRPEMAIRECNNALKIKPDDGETFFYLGRAHDALNKSGEASRAYKQAIIELEKATRADPNNSDNYYLLGNAYASDSQPKKAIASYVRSLELTPAFGRARYNLGVMYISDNNKGAATQQYNALAGIDPALAALLKEQIDAMK